MGGGGSPKNTTSTTTNNLDPNVARWTQNNYNVAQGVANQQYSPYTGQMVAPLNGLQLQGIGQGAAAATDNTGMAPINQGVANATAAGSYQPLQIGTGTWNSQTAQQYMNPYTQSVIDAANTNIDRNLAMTNQQTKAAATGAGAYGGDREAIMEVENARNANQLKAQTTAGLLSDAYTNAQGAFASDQSRALAAGQSNQSAGLQGANLGLGSADLLGRLGVAQQGVAQQNAGALMGYGSTVQDQQDAENQWNYQNAYLNPQQWPLRGLNALESAVSGIPYSTSSSTSTPIYRNKTAGALGGAATGASMGAMFGPWGAAIGGVAGGLMGAFG